MPGGYSGKALFFRDIHPFPLSLNLQNATNLVTANVFQPILATGKCGPVVSGATCTAEEGFMKVILSTIPRWFHSIQFYLLKLAYVLSILVLCMFGIHCD